MRAPTARDVLVVLAAMAATGLTQCDAGTLDLAGKRCPCVDGYVCDGATNTCVLSSGVVVDRGDATTYDGGAANDARSKDGSPGGDGCSGAACGCHDDSDCKDPSRPRCSPDGQCVECVSEGDNCPRLQYCSPTNHCAAGCKSNLDCAGSNDGGAFKLCDPKSHDCVECVVAGDCPTGMLCSPSGACVIGCDLSAGANCPAGKTCCDKLCIDTASDPLNCSACGSKCGGGSPACCSGTCVDRYTSTTNCGACGTACSTTQGTPSCDLGVCNWNCANGYAHCASGNTGCETNTTNNASHCGDCTTACATTVKNASGATCSSSTCTYASCASGFADCDADRTNGCETALGSPSACGSCSNDCYSQLQNAQGIGCAGGSRCTYTSCQPGFADCNANPSDGCEADLWSTATCGTCNVDCNTQLQHTIGTWCDGSCHYSMCEMGYGDCNGDPTDGCECTCGNVSQRCCPDNSCTPPYTCSGPWNQGGTCY